MVGALLLVLDERAHAGTLAAGARAPVDGIALGAAMVDRSALTGEADPVAVAAGAPICASSSESNSRLSQASLIGRYAAAPTRIAPSTSSEMLATDFTMSAESP